MSRHVTSARLAPRRESWLADAVIAGFVATGLATVALILAYIAAAAAGVERGGDVFRFWLWQLTHNDVVGFTRTTPAIAIMLHVVVGVIFAILYAYWGERWIARTFGPTGWRNGLIFGLLAYVASLLALLPAAGVNMLSFALSAGPLPVVGNLVLNLVYGAVLGQLYDASAEQPALAEDVGYHEPMEAPAVAHSEAIGAAGIVVGVILGAIFGLVLALLLPPTAPGEAFAGWSLGLAAAGFLAGGALGGVVGTFVGLPQQTEEVVEEEVTPDDPFDRNVLAFLIPPGLIVVAAGIVSAIGLALLSLASFGRMVPVYGALVLTFGVTIVSIVLGLRQPRSSRRATVSHKGH